VTVFEFFLLTPRLGEPRFFVEGAGEEALGVVVGQFMLVGQVTVAGGEAAGQKEQAT